MGNCVEIITRHIQSPLLYKANRIQNNMLAKKYTAKSDSKIDALILSLINEQYLKNSTEAQILAQSEHLKFYFTDLHEHITPENFLVIRKYQILPDGLYVLLKGQISFKQFNSSFQNEKDISKSKILNRNSSGMNYLSQTFSVFQSEMKNSAAVQDSYLLHIFESQKFETKFQQKFNQRKNLCQNYYLSHYHEITCSNFDSSELITADFRLHSNFVYKNYSVREILDLNDISIIKKGRVKFTVKSGYIVELQNYAILLSGINYEVTSSCLQLLTIYGNQDLNIKINTDHSRHKQQKSCWFPAVNKSILQSFNGFNEELKLSIKYSQYQNRKQRLKRQKQVTKLSKQSESYSIISSFLCKKSLDFAKKQIYSNKKKTSPYGNYKKPIVLFNFGSQKGYPSNLKPTQGTHSPFDQIKNGSIHSKEKQPSKYQADNKQNILRKLKLPLADYQKMLKKQTMSKTCTNLRVQNKAKSMFALTLAKHSSDVKQNRIIDQQAFVRYQDS